MLHHGSGDILHQCLFLLGGAALDGVDVNFRHLALPLCVRATAHYTGRGQETNIMARTKIHTGGCHCGRVRYEVTTELASVVACNCSICTKRARCGRSRVQISSCCSPAQTSLRTTNSTSGSFTTCFVGTAGWGPSLEARDRMAATRSPSMPRCLDDVDLDALKVVPF